MYVYRADFHGDCQNLTEVVCENIASKVLSMVEMPRAILSQNCSSLSTHMDNGVKIQEKFSS